MAMLARRGFRPELGRPDLPFARDLTGEAAERLGELLGHYSFRSSCAGPSSAGATSRRARQTRYSPPAQEKSLADALVGLGILVRPRRATATGSSAGRRASARPWSGTWRASCVAVGCDVATGVKFPRPRLGGDLDVVAALEGKLIYLELKSSPQAPHAGRGGAFFARVRRLRPDVAIFAMEHGAAAVGPGPAPVRGRVG